MYYIHKDFRFPPYLPVPPDIEALVQRLDPGRTSSPGFGDALLPSNAYTLDSATGVFGFS